MARGKKKETGLTPEEKLEQALVPDWEKPYPVPKNWIWSYIRSGYEVTSSKRVHKDDWLSEGIPFYRTRELVKLSENGYVDNELFISEEQYEEYKTAYGVPQMGDLLISGVGTIGVPYIVDSEEKFYFKDGNIIWFKDRGLFLPKYIYFLYKSLFMDNQIHEMSSGTTVDTYTIINANNTMVPVPSIAEQKRIVDRIEYLFAKLDEAKEKAQSVLDSFETRKAAILHKAFTGELSAKWREDRGVSAFSKMEKFGEITSEVRLGLVKGKVDQAYDKQYPYLKMNNITLDGRVDIEDLVCVDASEDEVKTYALREGDFLFNTRNSFELVGKNTVWNGEKSGVVLFNNNIMRVRFSSEINPRYVSFFFNSSEGKAQLDKCKKNTTNIAAIYAKNLNEIGVPIVSIKEQMEIVRILDRLFAKEQQAKEAAEAVLEKIDLLKKSILARAFRGELGTNDPTEESALELLKSVL